MRLDCRHRRSENFGDKQSYQVAQKGNYLSVAYGTTTVDAAITAGSWQYFTLSGDSSHWN